MIPTSNFFRRYHPTYASVSIRRTTSTPMYAVSDKNKENSIPSYWTRLNEPRTVMAPMVAQSDLPFRRLCRTHGTDLCYTQMIHATNFIASEIFQDQHLDVYLSITSDTCEEGKSIYLAPSSINSLIGFDWDEWKTINPQHEYLSTLWESIDNKDEKQNNDESSKENRWAVYKEGDDNVNPLIVQLAGHDPSTMLEAAKIILQRTNSPNASEGEYIGPVSGIDINCGCPQGIARKGRYGAFLMEESVDIVCDIISTLRENLPLEVGISCKIRLPQGIGTPSGDAALKERITKLIDAGVELITVHGRNIKENKTKVREANWKAIAEAVKIARDHSGDENFPVISNGGIEFPSDVTSCLAETGASAVMSSEALLENPGIFDSEDDLKMSPEALFQRQLSYCNEYISWCVEFPPLPGSLGKVGGSFNCIRAHIFKFLYRYLEEQPDLRARLGDNQFQTIQETRDLLKEFESRYRNVENWDELKSSNAIKSSWYRRHRDAINSSKMRVRGQKVESELANLSIEDKKKAMKLRLKKLKEQKSSKSKITLN